MTMTSLITMPAETETSTTSGLSFQGIQPKNLEEALKICEMIANSGIVPKHYAGRTEAVFTAAMYGARLGMDPMTACQSIAVINGRPCIFGDALLGIVRASGKLEYIHEDDNGTEAVCTVKRVGDASPNVRKFSNEDAKRAGLINKPGPWKDYPSRMRQMRARAFALRDTFTDILMGFSVTEEARDIPPDQDTHRVNVITTQDATGSRADRIKGKLSAPAPEPAPTDDFPSPIEAAIAVFKQTIDEAATGDDLDRIGDDIKSAPKTVRDALRGHFSNRRRALSEAGN